MTGNRLRRHRQRMLVLCVCSLAFVIPSIFPFFWMLSTSLKPRAELFATPVVWWPRNPTLITYANVLLRSKLGQAGLNSVFVASLTTLVALVLGISSGYGFARFRFFGRDYLGISVLFSQMLPQSVILIPLYLYFDRMRLIDTYPALVISYLAIVLPLCTWMLRGYFLGLPQEIEDSARIDGCSRLGVLFRIVLPLAAPAIVATGLFAFTVAWDEFLLAVVFTQTIRSRTLPVAIASFTQQNYVDWGSIMASAILMSIPVVVIFLTFQRHFVHGLAAGAVKG